MNPAGDMLKLANAMQVALEHIDAIEGVVDSLLERANTTAEEVGCLNDWQDEMTEAINNMGKRLDALEARQDPSAHNNIEEENRVI